MDLLRVERISKSYQGKRVVNEVNFTVGCGELVGLLGTNGAGKTTSFRMAVGLIRPESGKVYLGEEDITGCPIHVRARKGMGYLSQEPSVFQSLTVWDNLEAILEMAKPRSEDSEMAEARGSKARRALRRSRIESKLKEFGLWEHRKKYAKHLSGGQRRRLEIARTILLRPKLLLLDEPFTGLDPKVVGELHKLVRGLRRSGLGILLTDHNVREILRVTDRAYIMHDGVILRHGTPTELVQDHLVKKVYLGEQFDMGLAEYKELLESEVAKEESHRQERDQA